jgi:hypothetical protein
MSTFVGYTQYGDAIYNDSGSCWYQDSSTGENVDTACPVGSGGTYTPPTYTSTAPYNPIPAISINQGGVSVLSTGLDKVMASILSGLALMTGAPYVPTTTQPVKQNYTQYPGTGYPANYNPATGQYLAASNVNTGSSIQTWLQQNMVVVALGIGAFMLFKSGRK